MLNVSSGTAFQLEGEIGRRLKAVTEQWILPAPKANPALLAMFRDRDRKPYRKMEPWAGEFAGKYLTHSVQILRLTGDPKLHSHLEGFVKELCACQASDGYLGCWPEESRLTNHAPNCKSNWDTWSSYHTMFGLLLWNKLTGDVQALNAAVRIADLLCDRYLGKKSPRLVDTGWSEMNLAPIHSLCLLYRKTGETRHLALAQQILEEFSAKDGNGNFLAGNFLEAPLAGQEFYETPKPRWESLHPIMGMAELYYLTGNEPCRAAFETLWWSMLKGDRHNNGGFTSGEQATGNPYHGGAIETCCTVAWMALSVEMLRLTGSSLVADELELSMLNSGLGMMSPTGRWVTYNTPMDGFREASAHTVVFQSRAGSPELNCCSVNGPRALGILSEWAVMEDAAGLVLNYYGPGSIKTTFPSGNTVSIEQVTDYPRNAVIHIKIATTQTETFTLGLRIPNWSKKNSVRLNGRELDSVKCGDYFRILHEWKTGDVIRLELDFQLQFWRNPSPEFRYGVEFKDWETEWLLSGPITIRAGAHPGEILPADLTLDQARSKADVIRLVGTDPVQVISKAGELDLKEICNEGKGAGPHIAVWCFTEIDVPSDGTLPIAFDCDYQCSCFLNGAKVFSDEWSLNKRLFYSALDERQFYIPFQLKAGRNLIGFRVVAGTGGWLLSVGKGEFIPKTEAATQIVSIYRGPILLAYDARFNGGDYSIESVPFLSEPTLELVSERDVVDSDIPLILLSGTDTNGNTVRYCDFASAGATGNYYRSWVPVGFQCSEVEFSRENPRRSLAAN